MTKLTTVEHTDVSVSEFFDKGFLDNTEKMAELAKITERGSGFDSINMDKRLHLGEAQDIKYNQDYTPSRNSFSFQGILHPEGEEPLEFKSKFNGLESKESKEHREVMKEVYKSQFREHQSSSTADAAATSRDWIQHQLRSLDLDEYSFSSESVKTFPTRNSHLRGSGLPGRRKSIPHHLEPLHLQGGRKISARRGSLPVFMPNGLFQGPASHGTNKLSFSLPKITESAVVGRKSSSPWTEISDNTEMMENGENSISEVYRNMFGKKLKQPTTRRRRRTSFDVSSMSKQAEVEKRRPRQKWQILIHKRKSLFKDDIDFEPKLNRGKLPSTRLPRLLDR